MLLAQVTLPSFAAAHTIPALCVIEQSNVREDYSGPCRLWHGTGDSFTIEAVPPHMEILSTLSIGLHIERPGVADVRV